MAQGSAQKQSQGHEEPPVEPINEQQIGAEFAKALRELSRGEQTASNLESRLDDIESRIEQLLASAEENARQATALQVNNDTHEQAGPKSQPK